MLKVEDVLHAKPLSHLTFPRTSNSNPKKCSPWDECPEHKKVLGTLSELGDALHGTHFRTDQSLIKSGCLHQLVQLSKGFTRATAWWNLP